MRKFSGAALLILGITVVASSLWLIRHEYVVSRIDEMCAEQISDG